jgi:uracil DNA glycosylase
MTVVPSIPPGLEQIIEELRSGDINRQTKSLQDAAQIVRLVIDECLRTLATTQHPSPIAAQLYMFGPAIIPALEQLLPQGFESRRSQSHRDAAS